MMTVTPDMVKTFANVRTPEGRDAIRRFADRPTWANSVLHQALAYVDELATLIVQLRQAEQEAPDADEEPPWQSMESAPKDGTWFLWGQPEGNPHCCVIRWPEYRECWDAPGGRWMPLPEPPENGTD